MQPKNIQQNFVSSVPVVNNIFNLGVEISVYKQADGEASVKMPRE